MYNGVSVALLGLKFIRLLKIELRHHLPKCKCLHKRLREKKIKVPIT